MQKIFVLGIDGAMPEKIFGEWLDELPNIKKLMQNGCYAELNSTIPPLSGTAWTSVVTGKPPADTGIFEYIQRKNNSYDFGLISSASIHGKPLWEIISENNKKAISCFLPITWPVRPFKGELITGFLTPPGEEVQITHPKDLKKEIENNIGGELITDIPNFRKLKKDEAVRRLNELSDRHVDTVKYLIQNRDWDFLISVILPGDKLNHAFWKYQDKLHRGYKEKSKFRNILKDYYKNLDKRFGEIINLLDKDTIIIVMSDHGINRMHSRVNLTDWLIKNGYLHLKKPIKGKKEFDLSMVDWTKTSVFAIGAYDAEIFINLQGREPEGIVDHKDYDGLLEELERKLKDIKGERNENMNTKIFKKKDFFQGKCSETAPDMIVYFDDLQYGTNTTLIGNSTLWSIKTAKGSDDAGHSRQGIFIMSKSKRKGNIGEVDILDIAPTILNKLGVPIPEDMKGNIID